MLCSAMLYSETQLSAIRQLYQQVASLTTASKRHTTQLKLESYRPMLTVHWTDNVHYATLWYTTISMWRPGSPQSKTAHYYCSHNAGLCPRQARRTTPTSSLVSDPGFRASKEGTAQIVLDLTQKSIATSIPRSAFSRTVNKRRGGASTFLKCA